MIGDRAAVPNKAPHIMARVRVRRCRPRSAIAAAAAPFRLVENAGQTLKRILKWFDLMSRTPRVALLLTTSKQAMAKQGRMLYAAAHEFFAERPRRLRETSTSIGRTHLRQPASVGVVAAILLEFPCRHVTAKPGPRWRWVALLC